ncbi:MAG TPA: hypothetical protein VL202_04290 [Pararhizobium sp.]|nr:hypothetical protein [Pararhizobium sp.]HTO30389.1 hypothetical protein [Pararhizobium sp.]
MRQQTAVVDIAIAISYEVTESVAHHGGKRGSGLNSPAIATTALTV